MNQPHNHRLSSNLLKKGKGDFSLFDMREQDYYGKCKENMEQRIVYYNISDKK